MQTSLELAGIRLGYDTPSGLQTIVQDLDLRLEAGQIGCLLGESGCGKTTVLRAIAGFEPLRAGSITLNGRLLCGPGTDLPPEQRQVGIMFQDYALFPHLNVERNVGFGLRQLSAADRRDRVALMLERVGLSHTVGKYPHELSGGQQQRVALARALAPAPGLLLLDEPFSNLDLHTRESLAFEVRDILKQIGATAILVTHNQAEAFAIADRIGVMRQGNIVQWDTPYAVHHHPADAFVADFVRQHEVLRDRRTEALRRVG